MEFDKTVLYEPQRNLITLIALFNFFYFLFDISENFVYAVEFVL